MRNLLTRIVSFLFAAVLPVMGVSPVTVSASADDVTYTSALEDLKENEKFDESLYPDVADDYTLNVIQVAESKNNELYIYVYQPSDATKDLQASTINLSYTTDDDSIDYHLYSLSLTSSEGVFDKYRVNDFEVSSAAKRYYKIASIMRPFDEDIDEEHVDATQTISEVVFSVEKSWIAMTVGSEIVYSENKIEVVKITDKYTGFIRYYGNDDLLSYGVSWDNASDYDSFFVAIKTDINMEDLLSAKVYADVLKRTVVKGNAIGISWPVNTYNETHPENEFLVSRSETNEFKTDGIFGSKHSFKLIETVDEFNANSGTNLSSTDYDWVIRFFNAPMTSTDNTFLSFGETSFSNYVVSNVSVIELTFSKNGDIYRMGVVDNKQTGSRDPFNKGGCRGVDWRVLVIIAAVALIVIFTLKYEGSRKVVFWILKALGAVVAWPVLLTILIVQKGRGG